MATLGVDFTVVKDTKPLVSVVTVTGVETTIPFVAIATDVVTVSVSIVTGAGV